MPPTHRTFNGALWAELEQFIKTNPETAPDDATEDELRKSYQTSRALLLRLFQSPESETPGPSTPRPNLANLTAERDTAIAERDAAIASAQDAQTRLETMDHVLARLPNTSSTPRREKIPDPPKYGGDRAALRPFLTHLNLKLSGDHCHGPG